MLIESGEGTLDEEQCRALLAGGGTGRLGTTAGGLPVIVPVDFAVLGGDVVFRVAPSAAVRPMPVEAVVAFEVDARATDGTGDWSVLAIGRARCVTDPAERAIADAGVPSCWAPAPGAHYVRIRTEVLTGRRIVTP